MSANCNHGEARPRLHRGRERKPSACVTTAATAGAMCRVLSGTIAVGEDEDMGMDEDEDEGMDEGMGMGEGAADAACRASPLPQTVPRTAQVARTSAGGLYPP